jgi:hypothetical protein
MKRAAQPPYAAYLIRACVAAELQAGFAVNHSNHEQSMLFVDKPAKPPPEISN